MNADINGDGAVSFGDLNLFVTSGDTIPIS
jgi:hypothetical protein